MVVKSTSIRFPNIHTTARLQTSYKVNSGKSSTNKILHSPLSTVEEQKHSVLEPANNSSASDFFNELYQLAKDCFTPRHYHLSQNKKVKIAAK